MNRDIDVMSLRPLIDSIDMSKEMNENASFQNLTIRPILKLQSDVLVAIFKGHIHNKSIDFAKMPLNERTIFITNAVQKDLTLRNVLIGATIGLMTIDEISVYYENEAEFRNRIVKMIVQRLSDQI
jgi:hypothetical protein